MKKAVLFIACLLIFTSCFKEEDESKIYADVSGVVNSGNAPVNGAEIHIKSYLDPGGFAAGDTLGTGVPISLTISNPGVYTLELYRLGASEPIARVFEDTLGLGNQEILIPDSLLSNGVYIYNVINPLDMVSQSNFLVNRPDSSLPNVLPYAYTNSTGEFEIDADYLAIDTRFRRSDDETFVIKDSLQIIVVQNDEIAGRGYLKVKEESNFIEINLD